MGMFLVLASKLLAIAALLQSGLCGLAGGHITLKPQQMLPWTSLPSACTYLSKKYVYAVTASTAVQQQSTTSSSFSTTEDVTASSVSDTTDVTSTVETTTLPPLGPNDPIAIMMSATDPYFDASTPKNMTALVSKTAYLGCIVHNLGNKTVSWIRHRDLHILTAGSYTYTSDQRYQAAHHTTIPSEWTLQIKWAQKRDAGVYECQINTQPVRSYFIYLNIVDFLDRKRKPKAKQKPKTTKPKKIVVKPEIPINDDYQRMPADSKPMPTALILGAPDIHVDKGSTINLTCSIRFSPEPPAYIFWYHVDDVISYDSSRGGVSVITEKGDNTTSYLLIQNADVSDSGIYSCCPSNADVAIVRVHVLNGEHPAAMQTGSATEPNRPLQVFIVALTQSVVWFISSALSWLTCEGTCMVR